jgi:hypothetical protein
MIVPQLHRQPVALDSRLHRQTVVRFPIEDWSHLAGMNSLFLTAVECIQAAADYPIVFIPGGKDEQGQMDYAPIAVLGLAAGENLYLEGTQWRASQMPALMATYPFTLAQVPGDQLALCIDSAAAFAPGGEAQRLFDDAGEATPFARQVQAELEQLERQIASTRLVARRLAALDLLQARSFDATLPDGRKLSLDGFYTVDEERVRALPDATVLELHRNGILAMIHAHWVSLAQMRRLLHWRAARDANRPPG